MNKLTALFLLFLFTCKACYCETLPYNFYDTFCIPITLSITEEISTKDNIYEGQSVQFKVRKNVRHNGQSILKSGDVINAKIETIVTSGMNGFPAEIIIDDFQIPGICNSQLISTYNKKGQNRCLWVYPLKWSLTLIPFAGSLTNLIKGGHAKIRPKDIVTIYYYPNWKEDKDLCIEDIKDENGTSLSE